MNCYQISSPKRDAAARKGWSGFFPYYAGFSERFAVDLLSSAGLNAGSRIFDPWNGSGTTTYAASSLGLDAVGCDLNPVMVVIAKARLLPLSEVDSLIPIADEILRSARRSRMRVNADDPLSNWFCGETVSGIRAIEKYIRRNLVGKIVDIKGERPSLEKLSSIAAAMYVALFAICRERLGHIRTSNPTWVRKSIPQDQKSFASYSDLAADFKKSVSSMSEALLASKNILGVRDRGECILSVGNTADKSMYAGLGDFDFVLTSPPYCTRIDYTASTRVELAIISPWARLDTESLSRSMIGTVKVPVDTPDINPEWGAECISFLDAVRTHHSKASETYYYKNHVDYFYKMFASLQLISKSLKVGGVAAVIVQDSFYKNVHNDVPKILSTMLSKMGLRKERQDDFSPKRAMSGINKAHLAYKEYRHPTESVLIFQKEVSL